MDDGIHKTPVNDIIAGEDKDVGGIHPVVSDRLSKERSSKGFDSGLGVEDVEYVKKESMMKFVEDLNRQLHDISSYISVLMENKDKVNNAIMNLQREINNFRRNK